MLWEFVGQLTEGAYRNFVTEPHVPLCEENGSRVSAAAGYVKCGGAEVADLLGEDWRFYRSTLPLRWRASAGQDEQTLTLFSCVDPGT